MRTTAAARRFPNNNATQVAMNSFMSFFLISGHFQKIVSIHGIMKFITFPVRINSVIGQRQDILGEIVFARRSGRPCTGHEPNNPTGVIHAIISTRISIVSFERPTNRPAAVEVCMHICITCIVSTKRWIHRFCLFDIHIDYNRSVLRLSTAERNPLFFAPNAASFCEFRWEPRHASRGCRRLTDTAEASMERRQRGQ